MKKPVKIFIADDHRLILEGLATLIESIEGLQLSGKVNSGKELIDALSQSTQPDVCLIDIEMPGMDGIETVKIIRHKFPNIKILALTMHDESHFISRMITAGAHGYILKNVDRDVFENSIYKVMKGSDFFTEGVNTTKRPNALNDDLTHREQQILKLIALGKSNKEISEELFISDRTADTHRTNIKRKLQLSTLAELIQYAKANGYY
jgi:two-component system nitrate/nitrite response regulator NarL